MERSEKDKDYYLLLGVAPSAGQDAIGRAYRSLMKGLHPDAHRGRSDPDTGRRIAELVEAWRVLGDPARRLAYDSARFPQGTDSESEKGNRPSNGREPVLKIEPTILDLGLVSRGAVASGVLRLHNHGGPATVAERLDTTPPWISASRSEPGKPRDSFPMDMVIRADTAGLAVRRRHRVELVFRLANPVHGLRSPVATVEVAVTVTPRDRPRVKVSPSGWAVKPAECGGAPRSLLLHLFVSNSGGGELAGTIESSPWVRVSPHRFGPISGDAAPIHLSVELDCGGWAEADWPDSRVAVTADEGDIAEVALVADRRLHGTGWPWVPEWLPWQLVGMALWSLPALALLFGPWFLALGTALLCGFLLPPVLGARRRRKCSPMGSEEAEGWAMGPSPLRWRWRFTLLVWMALGLLAGIASSAAAGVSWLPLAVSAGGAAGAMAFISLAAPDRWILAPRRASGRGRTGYLGILGLATAMAWAVLGELLLRAVAGGSYPPMGAAFGWLVGGTVALGRNPDLLARDRESLAGLLWGIVPMVTAVAGMATVVKLGINWGIGAAAIGRTVGANTSAGGGSLLRALPAASLDSSQLALAACLGLLLGYGLGLMSLLPVIDVASPNRPIVGLLRELAEDVVFRHAGFGAGWLGHPDGAGSTSLFKGIMEMHWSTLMVLAAAVLLLIYSAALLLLALLATIGMAVG